MSEHWGPYLAKLDAGIDDLTDKLFARGADDWYDENPSLAGYDKEYDDNVLARLAELIALADANTVNTQ